MYAPPQAHNLYWGIFVYIDFKSKSPQLTGQNQEIKLGKLQEECHVEKWSNRRDGRTSHKYGIFQTSVANHFVSIFPGARLAHMINEIVTARTSALETRSAYRTRRNLTIVKILTRENIVSHHGTKKI